MKQTASVNECAVGAVVPRIRNAGNWSTNTGDPEDFAPHNTTISGTNRVFY
jgi:hypothetical protein